MSVEKIHQVSDGLAVLRLVDRADTGSGTQLDVVVQTRTFIHPCDLAVTSQIGKDTAKHIQCLINSPGRSIRPKITRSILNHLPCHSDLRERLSPVDFDV